MGDDTARGDVATVREVARRWTEAVAGGDVRALAGLMTEDVVVVHGDGRVLRGRDAVVEDLAGAFRDLRIAQNIEFEETVVAGEWAFDRATAHTVVTRRADGERAEVVSRTMTILRRDGAGAWRVARVMGVVVRSRPES